MVQEQQLSSNLHYILHIYVETKFTLYIYIFIIGHTEDLLNFDRAHDQRRRKLWYLSIILLSPK
jgi:hypothetical protein